MALFGSPVGLWSHLHVVGGGGGLNAANFHFVDKTQVFTITRVWGLHTSLLDQALWGEDVLN